MGLGRAAAGAGGGRSGEPTCGVAFALAVMFAIRWGYPLADPLAAIAVATLIAANAIAREVRRCLGAEVGCAFCVIHVDPAPLGKAAGDGRAARVGTAIA